jgi:predicted porin
MKKTLLAVAIPAALFANAVSAVELYKDDVNTFKIGGHMSAGLIGSDEGDTKVNSVSPRINMEAIRDLGNGVVVDAKAEWALNMLDGGDNSFTTRLGYVGATHEDFGRGVIGTQWAPFYDVAGVADMPIAFANDFLYDDHGNVGTARAKNMVSYRNGLDFGDFGALNLGIGWQGKNSTSSTVVKDDGTEVIIDGTERHYSERVQAAISYDLMGFSVGYGYNSGDIDYIGGAGKVTAEAQAISASYGNYGSGLFVAAVYTQNDWIGGHEETNNYEAIAAYALANSLNLSINYEAVVDESTGSNNGDTIYSQSALQVEYNFLPNVVGYAGYEIDLGGDGQYDTKKDNTWMFGGRVYL